MSIYTFHAWYPCLLGKCSLFLSFSFLDFTSPPPLFFICNPFKWVCSFYSWKTKSPTVFVPSILSFTKVNKTKILLCIKPQQKCKRNSARGWRQISNWMCVFYIWLIVRLFCDHMNNVWHLTNSSYISSTVVYASLDLWYLYPVQVSFIFTKAAPVTNIVYNT